MTQTFETLIEQLESELRRYQAELAQAQQQIHILQQTNQELREQKSFQQQKSAVVTEVVQHDWQLTLKSAPQSCQIPTVSPQALLVQWYERYPNVFFRGHTKPLKIGIHEELVKVENWPPKLIRRALAHYVNLPRYLKSLRVGAHRINLTGETDGIVEQHDCHYAEQRLTQLQAQRKAREQLQSEQRLVQKLAQLNAAFNEKS